MIRVVRGGTGAPSGMRAFPGAGQRLLRCDKPRCTRDIQQGRRYTRRSCPRVRTTVKHWPLNDTGMCTASYLGEAGCWRRLRPVMVNVRAGADYGYRRRRYRHSLSDNLRKENRRPCGFHSTFTGNADSFPRHGATVPPHNPLHEAP